MIDGIYSADPKLDKKAKKLDSIDYDGLIKLVAGDTRTAGATTIFDQA